MKNKKKAASGAGAIILLLIIILAVIDVMTGFTEKGIDNMKNEKKTKSEYIGKPEINVKDRAMTPDALLDIIWNVIHFNKGKQVMHQPLYLQCRRQRKAAADPFREKLQQCKVEQ